MSEQSAPLSLTAEVDPRLLEILVCPVTHGPLVYDRAAGELVIDFVVHDGGPATEWAVGTHLAGAALGARGSWRGLNYDVAVATPIHYPKPLSNKSPSLYASLSYTF